MKLRFVLILSLSLFAGPTQAQPTVGSVVNHSTTHGVFHVNPAQDAIVGDTRPSVQLAMGGGNPDRGSFLFAAYCASCHGDSGQGDGPMAPRLIRDFHARPSDLTLPGWQSSHTQEQILQVIRHGGKSIHKAAFMPAWAATLDDQETSDLAAFVRELGLPSPSGYAPAATLAIQQKLELGRSIYGMQCLACHGARGRGDGPTARGPQMEKKTPDFGKADYFLNKTDAEIAEWAQSGVYHSGIPIDANQSRWYQGPLNADEIPALLLYLRSLPLR